MRTSERKIVRPLPADVKPRWLNVIRRLQSANRRNHGHALLTITVLVDAKGYPLHWTEPKVTLIEPKDDKGKFLELLEELTA